MDARSRRVRQRARMKAKARSLSAPREGKSKVALNCITRSDVIKDGVIQLPNSLAVGRGEM